MTSGSSSTVVWTCKPLNILSYWAQVVVIIQIDAYVTLAKAGKYVKAQDNVALNVMILSQVFKSLVVTKSLLQCKHWDWNIVFRQGYVALDSAKLAQLHSTRILHSCSHVFPYSANRQNSASTIRPSTPMGWVTGARLYRCQNWSNQDLRRPMKQLTK